MKIETRLLAILIGSLLCQALMANNLIDRFRVPIKLYSSSSFGYDNNVFRLSDLERNQEYSNSKDINIINSRTFDGAYISPKISIKYAPHIIDQFKTEFKFAFNRNVYMSIPEKSYSVINSELGIKLGSYRWIRFSHRYLPRYYLKNYKDRDYSLNDYYECLFSSESFKISYSHPINRKIWSRVKYSKINMYYNDHFTEYDIVSNEIEARLYFKMRGFDSNFAYSYSASSNILDDINSESSNSDRSYKTHVYGLSTKKKIRKISYVDNFGISLIVKNRIYEDLWPEDDFEYIDFDSDYVEGTELSGSVSDPLHYGRQDVEYNFSIWLSNKINKTFSHEVRLKYRWKDVHSEFMVNYINGMSDVEEVLINDLKEFNKFEIIYKITYNMNLDIL